MVLSRDFNYGDKSYLPLTSIFFEHNEPSLVSLYIFRFAEYTITNFTEMTRDSFLIICYSRGRVVNLNRIHALYILVFVKA